MKLTLLLCSCFILVCCSSDGISPNFNWSTSPYQDQVKQTWNYFKVNEKEAKECQQRHGKFVYMEYGMFSNPDHEGFKYECIK